VFALAAIAHWLKPGVLALCFGYLLVWGSCNQQPTNRDANANANTHSHPYPNANTDSVEAFDIDREVAKLKTGVAITEFPDSMELGETRTVVVVLSPMPEAGAAKVRVEQNFNKLAEAAPARKLKDKTKIETEEAKYSSLMEAKLTGQGFDIKAVTPERQPVSSNQETKWTWEVKSLSAGDNSLYISLNAIFERDKEEETRSVNTFSKAVVVRVSWGAFLSNNWQWIATVIIIPIVGVAVRWGGPILLKRISKPPSKKK